MSKTKKLFSRQDLNTLMKKVPAPILEHLKRCKKLAKFFVERLLMEDWYSDLKINDDDLIASVYYHDIGKFSLPKDCYYLKHCETNQKKETYQEHVQSGIRLINKELGLDSVAFEKSKGFPGLVYHCIMEHHERVDGKGFPRKLKGEEISFVGRFTALVDTFDNLLFVGTNKEIDFASAFKEIESLAGTVLDERLVNTFLKDKKALKNFCNEELHLQKTKHRTNNRYGMHVLFRPIIALDRNKAAALNTSLIINDPYYGIVEGKMFLPVAERNHQIRAIDKIYIEKVFRTIWRARYRGIFLKNVFLNLPTEMLSMKTFLPYFEKQYQKFEIQEKQVVICLTEADIHQSDMDLKTLIDSLHRLGVRFAVSSFGEETSIVTLLSELSPDYVLFSEKVTQKMYTDSRVYDVVSGLAKIPLKLGIRMVFEGISDSAQNIKVTGLGGKYVSGPLFGKDMYQDELFRYLGSLET